ncbi:hypothetical protein [Burkholderia sp. L27(2015)]|uniref:hypothetical protein n=1 Tax=Burkholderia sp. L27(2015) TaxID=1641858 RepID=UPI00131E2811|nr:hypothetical protein [Burkholderia sp. L27(2015)]
MQISKPIGSFPTTNSAAGGSSVNGNASSGAPSFQALLAELNGFAQDSPGQWMEAMVLAQLGLTPADLQKMTPQERLQVEEKIKELLKAQMQKAKEESAEKGHTINVSV